ncbi:ACT domain-containing protein [Cellulomonas wangsupingiae]|uniref:ACT domain-containing protein n=1 Tax=Cellulomonas wangsupingiae TaxID=2968085 RepID=A0ABY5K451_9CELL|nr:ACT domain-containing protein [Cellulomonas wangsupingiae]MCC2333984.1 ACT domain-containing protein [Cellulomonas wangsupingiae]MCM0640960.1 ACT domain-containing protein [Cellulomonas wangsupingiae]UUI65237.1 ACT domain-containing protein [Cellulomonas wangsupingiae]
MSDDDTRWVGWVRTEHRTGAIFALAGVFSTRGVNVDSMATGDVHDDDGMVVVTFRAGERRSRLLTRTLERLPQVRSVRVCRVDDPDVRAAAVVHLPAGVTFTPPPGAAVRWSGRTDAGEPLLVEGPLADVEATVRAARGAGATRDATVVEPPST